MGWVNQASRCTGPGSLQVSFGRTGITRLQEGKPLQGEANCQPVAEALLAWLGEGFRLGAPCPASGAKRNSAAERGADFTVFAPCGHEVEVQVTRVIEQDHYSSLGDGKPVHDGRSHSSLVALIDDTVRKKTDRTPANDRAVRILAIDGRCPSIGFNLFLTGVKFVDMPKVFGWRGVLLVIDKCNTRFLDRDGWPSCAACTRSSQL